MKQSRDSYGRTKVALTFWFLPAATIPLIYGIGQFETIASWYGPGFQGRRTASGERFDQEAMTAASKTLPFGTHVLVRNPRNGRECTVVINDRGPYVAGRGIDLSHAAARRLGIGGVAPVICYVGGSSYYETARKYKHHKESNEGESSAPYAVPVPRSETAEIASALPQKPAVVLTEGTANALPIASVPSERMQPADTQSDKSASVIGPTIDHAQIASTSLPISDVSFARSDELTGGRRERSQAPQQGKVEQLPSASNIPTRAPSTPPQANAQLAQSTNSNSFIEITPDRTIAKVQPEPPKIVRTNGRNNSIVADKRLAEMNESFNKAEVNKLRAVLAATGRMYYTAPVADQWNGKPAVSYAPVQQAGPVWMSNYAAAVAAQNLPPVSTTNATQVRTKATGKSSMVAHSNVHRYARHTHWGSRRTDHVDAMMGRLTNKIAHVCKGFLANL
jgi:hypothetical protein